VTLDPANPSPTAPSEPATANPPSFIRFRRQGLRVGEVYFADCAPEALPAVDYLRLLAVLEPGPERQWARSDTLLVDLTLSDDELLKQMAKGTRYEVQRGMTRDGLAAEVLVAPAPEEVSAFADYYDRFAEAKGLSRVFRPRLEALAQSGLLTLSHVTRDSGEPLAWHAYARSEERAMLMLSASQFRDYEDSKDRSLMGRANRYLHWEDMLGFKAASCSVYDLGGVDLVGRDPATARIAAFKRGFGGRVQPTYRRSQPLSARGRVAAAALRARRTDF
jgi:hypothetical protein